MPAFALERCGFEADDLAAVIAEEKSATRLQAVTPGGRRAGLRPFMTATEARALVPDVELVPHDVQGEQEDRAALVRRCAELSDRVRAPWPDTLVAEVSGTSHLFGGEKGLAARAKHLLGRLGHVARVAVADDALTARALARWGREGVVPAGKGGDALAELPLVSLEPSETLRGALLAVGVERVGEFARLASPAVATRFGDEGVRLHKVAQGRARGGVNWEVADDAPLVVHAALGGATSTLQINFVLPGLLSKLSRRLADRGLAVIRLRVVLHLEVQSGAPRHRGIGVTVGRATRDPQTLERLVRLRLEGTQIESPVEDLAIEVIEAVPEVGWQPGLTDRTEATEPLPDVLARLADHLGHEALCGAVLVDRWKPEGAWAPTTWPPRQLISASGSAAGGPRGRQAREVDPVWIQQAHEAPIDLPRPSVLLPKAVAIEVRVGASGPTAMRLAHGWEQLLRCEGPERLRSDWWQPESWSRDYWVVACEDKTAWIYADNRGGWFVHGWFD